MVGVGLEKIDEVALLNKLFHGYNLSEKERECLEHNRKVLHAKQYSELVVNKSVAERLNNVTHVSREGNFDERIEIQKKQFNLPPMPTTTIGSFPQTAEIRKNRMDFKKGRISSDVYESKIKDYINDCISFQENIGLDVLVHGEPERNDMVEYFAELLNGFYITRNGWVQSYGSRCVKPPIIYGDISRSTPMTVKWISYAQSKTKK